MKKTGEILKKVREEKGLSLNEVGLSLKISSKVLKAIEEGDEKNLPAKTFLRGFVKSYASFLRLDADKVLETFYEEYGSTRPQPYIRPTQETAKEAAAEEKAAPKTGIRAESAEPVSEKPAEKPADKVVEKPVVQKPTVKATEATVTPIRSVQSTPSAPTTKTEPYSPLQEKKNTKTIAICVIGALLVGLILFTKKMIDKYTKEAEVPVAQVVQTMEGATPVATTAPVESMTPEATPQPSPLSDLTKAPSATVPATMATPKSTPQANTTEKAAPAVVATPTPAPTAAATVTPTPTATVAASPTASPSPSPSPKPEEKNKPVELIVEALDSVEIEYAAPNGKPQKIKLSAEQVHTFKSRSGLKINFSNGGAVNLILNGKEVGIPGDLGKPIKLSY